MQCIIINSVWQCTL